MDILGILRQFYYRTKMRPGPYQVQAYRYGDGTDLVDTGQVSGISPGDLYPKQRRIHFGVQK